MKNSQNTRITTAILISVLLVMTLPAMILAQEQQVTRQEVDRVLADLVKWEQTYLKQLLHNRTPDKIVDPALHNWPTLALAIMGYSEGLGEYITETERFVRQNWKSASRKVTDLERIVLTLGAAKSDPHHFGDRDLIAEIYNYPNIEA